MFNFSPTCVQYARQFSIERGVLKCLSKSNKNRAHNSRSTTSVILDRWIRMHDFRGAEAVVYKATLLGRPVVVKERLAKTYRVSALDRKLRSERTRAEARLLHKAKLAGVCCPTVLEVDELSFSITTTFIDGVRPGGKMLNPKTRNGLQLATRIGSLLAKLHQADIIHGDFTPANLIVSAKVARAGSDELYVIDFGLGFISNDVEDKAVDVFTMLRALGTDKNLKVAFLSGYSGYAKAASVLKRVEGIEKRVRYAI